MTEPHDLELPPELAARIRLGDPTLVCAHYDGSGPSALQLVEIAPDSPTPQVNVSGVITNQVRGRALTRKFALGMNLAGAPAYALHWVDHRNVVFVEP